MKEKKPKPTFLRKLVIKARGYRVTENTSASSNDNMINLDKIFKFAQVLIYLQKNWDVGISIPCQGKALE